VEAVEVVEAAEAAEEEVEEEEAVAGAEFPQDHLLSPESWEAIPQKNSTETGKKVKPFYSTSFFIEG